MKDYKDIHLTYSQYLSKEECQPFTLFGFECDIGWYDIIKNVFYVIDWEYKHKKQRLNYLIQNKHKFISDAVEKQQEIKNLQQQIEDAPIFVQIKEKFGTLRMYYDGGDEFVRGIVGFAEHYSCFCCEKCGNTGEMITNGGWHQTLCNEHSK